MREPQGEVFGITGFMRFYLVLQLLFPLFLIGITVWAVSSSRFMVLTDEGPFILIAFGVWAIWEFVVLVRWIGFTVHITDDAITARGRSWEWKEIVAAKARNAIKFKTFIELEGRDGSRLEIPAAIQKNAFVLTLVEKHVPGLVREG